MRVSRVGLAVSYHVYIHTHGQIHANKGSGLHPVVFPSEGQIRFAGQGSRSSKFAIFWAAGNRNYLFLDVEGN
jgi:hypothetical protein